MIEQEKRKKVIRGLECCSAEDKRSSFCRKYDCPYRDYEECPMNLMRDALDLLKAQEPITGETSDGYHTFNELYHHRTVLFSVIVANYPERAWKAKKHHDGMMYDGMFIVGIETPDGQATYHYDIDPYWDMFKCRELVAAPEWDGHTPAQAIERIGKLALLKAQEPRVMTLEEVVKWEGAFWLEFLEEDNDDFIRYGYAFFSSSTPNVIEIIARDSYRPLYAFIVQEYGARWRCWTSRPTNKQSKSTPWE